MTRPFLRPALLLGLTFLLGFLSMGIQLVATRLLAPDFGSSIIVWAYLISTFLFAFSAGSMLGGWICRTPGVIRMGPVLLIAALAMIGFAIIAFAGKILIVTFSDSCSEQVALFLSCAALFILPIASISTLPPVSIQALSQSGISSGLASGLVYGISTIGNIAGVMVTSFFLIPHFGISNLLLLWFVVSVIELSIFCYLLSRPVQIPKPIRAPRPEGVEYAHES